MAATPSPADPGSWPSAREAGFPPPQAALDHPPGLLAIGGDLSPPRLLAAYAAGIFPWPQDDAPMLWWCPDPRAVIRPRDVRITRSLRKRLRNAGFVVSLDEDFDAVMRGCAGPRAFVADTGTTDSTWITEEMIGAYGALHRLGFAHSVEVRLDGALVGGLYGVAIGRCFFGESMFSREPDASKVAFVHLLAQLAAWDFPLVDCQLPNPHLDSLGVGTVDRAGFLQQLADLVAIPGRPGPWRFDGEQTDVDTLLRRLAPATSPAAAPPGRPR